MKIAREDDGEALSANRRGEMTPEQKAKLAFGLEARQLGAFLGILMALGGVCLFGSILGTALARPAGWEALFVISAIVAAGLYTLWSSQRTLRRLQRSRYELKAGHLSHADGEVYWNGKRYAVRMNASEKILVDAQLAPGSYRFYYVPFSGVALSVERLGAPRQVENNVLDALMRALHFDWEALVANRTGRLGQTQRARLYRSLLRQVVTRLLVLIAGGAAFVYFAVRLQLQRGGDVAWTALLAAGPFLILALAAAADFFRGRRDILDGRVTPVQGIGIRRPEGDQWEIGGFRFRVSSRSSRALITGLRYRAYYLVRTQWLVSVEPLGAKGAAGALDKPLPNRDN